MESVTMSIPKELFAFLIRENAILAELIALAEEQQRALTHYEAEALHPCLRKQAELFKELRLIERERLGCLSLHLGISFSDASKISISDICKRAGEEEQRKLRHIQNTLRLRSLKLQQLNNLNRLLTERSKNFIQSALNVITNNGAPLYNRRV